MADEDRKSCTPVSEKAQDVWIRQQFREVALPHSERWHGYDVGRSFREAITFVVEEKEGAVPEVFHHWTALTEVRNNDWTTNIEAEVVLIVARPGNNLLPRGITSGGVIAGRYWHLASHCESGHKLRRENRSCRSFG